MDSVLKTSYEQFPYESLPFPQTHPERIAAIARLFGLATPPVERARVLEIGCAAGGNIIPLATTLPEAEFVGVDFSGVQVRDGLALVDALGLSNLRLLEMDIARFGESHGKFDYIVAHGVFSWVPPEVQDAILALCRRQLAPNGIAYISYNTLPGWGMRGAVRAAMRYQTAQFSEPATLVQQARAMLDFLAASVRDGSPYATMLRTEAEHVRTRRDYYILHEYLEAENHPFYFHEFIERAGKHGLRYLAEADFSRMFTHDLAPEAVQTLMRIAPDLVKREQFLDFLRNSTFRQTLLVHDAARPERKIAPWRMTALHVASRLRPTQESISLADDAPAEFRVPAGPTFTAATRVTKAALVVLAEHWPAWIPFEALCAAAAVRARCTLTDEHRGHLAATVLNVFAAGLVEVHSVPPPFVLAAGPQPTISLLARVPAARGPNITHLRHEPLTMGEATRAFLVRADGSRTRDALAEAAWPRERHEVALALVDEALTQLARQALLSR